MDEQAPAGGRDRVRGEGTQAGGRNINEREQRVERSAPTPCVQRIDAGKPCHGEKRPCGVRAQADRTEFTRDRERRCRDYEGRRDFPMAGPDGCPRQLDDDEREGAIEEVGRVTRQRF